MMARPGYYDEKLSAERLRACYDLAPPRIRKYLEAEIAFVLERIRPAASVLELGCGYGRVLHRLERPGRSVTGIDTSPASLRLARTLDGAGEGPSIRLFAMDATRMGFRSGTFDSTLCIQNGISAFGVDRSELLREAARVTRSGGLVLFSSYAERFWEDRLNWFRLQAGHGLLGPIDEAATGNGVIVCEDGFRASTVGAEEFERLASGLRLAARTIEVDGSSLFCEIVVP